MFNERPDILYKIIYMETYSIFMKIAIFVIIFVIIFLIIKIISTILERQKKQKKFKQDLFEYKNRLRKELLNKEGKELIKSVINYCEINNKRWTYKNIDELLKEIWLHQDNIDEIKNIIYKNKWDVEKISHIIKNLLNLI